MTCPCGEPAGNHSTRCDACQRAAVLAALGWTEEEARAASVVAMHQSSNRQKGRIVRRGLK